MKKTGVLAALLVCAGLLRTEEKVDFVRQVRPVFEKSCFQCHGEKVQQGSLRLDSREAAARVITSGALYARIAGIGGLARMPMGGKPLESAQIALVKKWIDEENSARKHWAFIPPVRPALPAAAKHPIDAFVLARLTKEGLKPSPEADRVALLRRLSLDLIGLPPTPEEVDAFLADKSRNAYEKQVERLLRSPHYGERWGRLWLDAARYADSDGFEKDKHRFVWFYRDWVINALNRDLPYNQFILEQLAGDLLPNATQDQIVATGFLRNSMINEEGGIDPEQFRMEAMFDRMDAIGKSMLGVTIQCAQCHNHKYDPLTQEEYYRIFAYFNNSHEGSVVVYTPGERKKRAEILRRIQELEAALPRKDLKGPKPEWTVVQPAIDDISTGGQKYLLLKDGSILAQGYAPTKHTVKLTVKTRLKDITAFRLELLNDPNLPLGGPGRSIKGTGALTEFMVDAAPADQPEKTSKIKIARAAADISLPETPLEKMFYDKTDKRRVTGPIEYAIDGKDETAWGHDAGPVLRNLPRKAVFVAEKPVGFDNGTVITFQLKQNHGGWNSDDNMNHNLGRFRLSVTTSANAEAEIEPQTSETNERIAALWKQHPEGASQLVLRERDEMRSTNILARGDFLKPQKPVRPGAPAFLNPLPEGAPENRLGFARWLTDRKSPTVARAFVNRVWQTYFGTGIVATSEDLGRQSEAPSHPELLDWLAVEFMEKGWSVKELHRLIVTSAAYRQSSRVNGELQSKDPFNRLLARGPRFRVDAEIVRDISLAASGLLNAKVGGPSVYPAAPEFLFQPPVSYGPKNWYEEKGEERYRRALYTFRFRSVPYPMLQVFDAPNGDFACVRRSRANTPLQALVTLNEPMFLEAARALALRTLRDGGKTDGQRLTYAFRRCVSREPNEKESGELLGLLARQARRFADGAVDPYAFTELKPYQATLLPGGATAAQAAAWTAVSRVLLNLDETITKE
jgi:hypothetical protein